MDTHKLIPSMSKKRSIDETKSDSEKWNEQQHYNNQKILASLYQQQQYEAQAQDTAEAKGLNGNEREGRSNYQGSYLTHPNSNYNYYPFESFTSMMSGNDSFYPNKSNIGKMAPQTSPGYFPNNSIGMDTNNPNSIFNSLKSEPSYYQPHSHLESNSEDQQNGANNLSYLANYSTFPSYMRPYNSSFELPLPNTLDTIATKQLLGMRNPSTSTPKKPSSLTIVDTPTDQPSAPITVFRNLFHSVYCNINNFGSFLMDGQRVYVEDRVGYSGNATRFKKIPDVDEKAYILSVNLLDSNKNPVYQCKVCREYYDHQRYFKSSPDALGKVVLVKNNSPIRIDRDGFKIAMKVMCACSHHNVDYFQCILSLRKAGETQISHTASINLYSKQWRKSNQKKEDLSVNFYSCGEDTTSTQSYPSLTFGSPIELPFTSYQPPKPQMNANNPIVLAENSA
eukprot:TRINITY_DN3704_c0_g1_i1.p1 TRINITY_DN3704_c0_g1~~TRINITY_DN3704_c0_g1_i1.p1  ORF type:complete len:451 (-),score=113.09 TRINITY_DN3704_c0_g1_i1:217-1569(-)